MQKTSNNSNVNLTSNLFFRIIEMKGKNKKMSKYESIMILVAATAAEEITAIIEKVKELITSNDGTILKIENIGKKKLAYEIKKNTEGIYIVVEFEVKSEVVSELERYYRIKEEIIKFLTVKHD